MSQHLSRRSDAPNSRPVDDWQLGPDTDEWPGEQMRRLDDHYRSWRHDRYRESSDEPARNSHERAQAAPSVRYRRERSLSR